MRHKVRRPAGCLVGIAAAIPTSRPRPRVGVVAEAVEGRYLLSAPINAIFVPSQGDWGSAANWNTGSVPNSADNAFVINGSTATISSDEPATTNVYVGQGDGNGNVQQSAGSLTAEGVYLGRDTDRSGFWYQTGGSLTAPTIELSSSVGTTGRFEILGGTITSSSAVNAGNAGFGGFTVAGGALAGQTLNIAEQTTADSSYFNVANGIATFTGNVNVGSAATGSDGLLDLSGGTFAWGGTASVQGSGSSLEVDGGAASIYATGAGAAPALTIGSGGTLQFDIEPSGISTVDLGTSSLDIASGSTLVVDGSRFDFSDTSSRSFTLATFGSLSGLSSFPTVSLTGFLDKSAAISYTANSIVLTVGPSSALSTGYDNTNLVATGAVNTYPANDGNYNYCPSYIYDETDGMYKVWSCWREVGVTGDLGDNIGFKEYPTIAGLNNAPISVALPYSGDPTKFDDVDACDPNVYRVGNIYYMAYDGNTDGTDLPEETRIGFAESTNGGRTFVPLYTSTPGLGGAWLAPTDEQSGGYGVGQPCVAQVGNLFYMAYTNSPGGSITNQTNIVSSTSPVFTTYTSVVTNLGHTEGVSLDMMYDPSTQRFTLTTDANDISTVDIGDNSVRFETYTSNWTFIISTTISTTGQSFSFGEGLSLLTNSQKQPIWPDFYSVVGSSINLADRNTDDAAYWVKGPMEFNTYVVAVGGTSGASLPSPQLPVGWSSTDVGEPPVVGSATGSGTSFTIAGSGTDIASSSQFDFASQSLNGSGQITAQISSVSSASALAGVMIRDDTSTGSAFADVIYDGGLGLAFQWRSATGAAAQQTLISTAASLPLYVRLDRSGSSFTAFYSTTGSSWTQIGTAQSVTMGVVARVGMAVTSGNTSATATATFSQVALAAGTAVALVNNGSSVSNATQPLSFTATVSGGVPDGETLTLEDASNNNAVVASATISAGSATFSVPAGALPAGSHSLVAVYAGDVNYAASVSNALTQTVQVVVTGVTVNGNLPSLAGAQRSVVDSIVYDFSEPVQIGAGAFTIAVHSGQSGTVPSLSWTAVNPGANGSSSKWAVTFSGAGVNGDSIGNGVYDITINAAAVSSAANPAVTAQPRAVDTFYRLYGDLAGNQRVTVTDYSEFLSTYNLKSSQTGYIEAFDATGTDARISVTDYSLFLADYQMHLTGFTATI